ncbi:hypothetical protein PAPYR_11301 [Paratrimastix pyriformis]|uniref:Uncharacterized protein n=1 Tax=Paratrimastix pyriformis TaxID=342808 RepID=A0ABQ8U907_9EUKA|nr:hypothetical protein PAPYR_11301 [Paratrimastix pyriformis]
MASHQNIQPFTKLALPLPTLLPIPEKCGAGYRFSLGNVVSHLVAHFDIRTTPPNPRPAATEPLDEFWKGSRFALKYEEHVKHHVGIFLPLIVYVDDLGVYNGLHSHRPYCAIWVTPAGIPHRIRNTVGWLPLGVLANPTRLAKQTLFQCICQDFVAAQEQATSPQSPFPVLFAVTGDSVALAEICGVVRPGRSAHGCLYCETFARNSTSVCPAENSTPRTPAREAELQRRFESASNATSQRLQRDTGYLPTGCPALRFPLGFDPYVSALPDLDHIESGHTTRFILARVLQGPLRSLAIARLEQLRDHLPSHVGALPRLSHAKKLSFTELRLLLQLCGMGDLGVAGGNAANARKATRSRRSSRRESRPTCATSDPTCWCAPARAGDPTVIELAVTTAVRDEDLAKARDGKLAQYRGYCQAAGFDNRALLFGATGCIPGQSVRDLLQLVPGTEHKTLCEALRRISGDLTRSILALFLMRDSDRRDRASTQIHRPAAAPSGFLHPPLRHLHGSP